MTEPISLTTHAIVTSSCVAGAYLTNNLLYLIGMAVFVCLGTIINMLFILWQCNKRNNRVAKIYNRRYSDAGPASVDK